MLFFGCRTPSWSRSCASGFRKSANTRTPGPCSSNCASCVIAGEPASGAELAAALRIVLLPVPSVDEIDLHAGHGGRIDAARVDAEAIGVRPRHVERFDAAGGAEVMPRRPGVERIGGQGFLALDEPEAMRGHDEMLVREAAAHRAIALIDAELGGCLHFEAHASAMASALVVDHERSTTHCNASAAPASVGRPRLRSSVMTRFSSSGLRFWPSFHFTLRVRTVSVTARITLKAPRYMA